MTAPHAHHPAAPSCCRTNAGPRARWLAVLGALLASTMVQASAIQSPGPGIELPMSRPPGIELPRGERATGPALGPARAPESPSTDVRLGPEAPAMPSRAAGTQAGPVRLTDPALLKELTRLRRVAEPASGFGSTTAAANAAWTLGLIELHGGAVQRSPAQAQTWFERATRWAASPWPMPAWPGATSKAARARPTRPPRSRPLRACASSTGRARCTWSGC